MRVDVAGFAVFDERCDYRPVVPALVGAGERGILAIHGQGFDAAFDGVAVEVDAAVVQEA